MPAPSVPEIDPRKVKPTPAMRHAAFLFQLHPPVLWQGARFTPRRVQNLVNVRREMRLGATRLTSFPLKLTIEATNICNLRCPACFTGAGLSGRSKRPMPFALYERLLDELAPYAFEIELHNWGEPLLAKNLGSMVAMASRYGVSTTVSSNMSVPFDEARAEALVSSGLHVLGVSLDGATQSTYEQYRRRGNIELALANCRLVRDAKRRLGSSTPRMVWEYHVFSHNVHEIDQARALAAELEMDIAVEKGWVVGEDWDKAGAYRFFTDPSPSRCHFLWYHAVINNDGGVAPCCGTFYAEDDFAKVSVESLQEKSFHDVWNSRPFQDARRLFRSRSGPEHLQQSICFDCPKTVVWERFKQHLAESRPESFEVGVSMNDIFNYLWNHRSGIEEGLVQLKASPGRIKTDV